MQQGDVYPPHDELEPAIAEWTAVLGADWVNRSTERLAQLERATFTTTGRVVVHLRPGTVPELGKTLEIASRHRISVNVFGRGKSFGYAANGPCSGVAATIELSRLTAITEFDEKLGYVRVQAGVTFAQLSDYLAAQGSCRFLPATGGPSDGSVLANTVERGHGLGFGGDRYAHSCRYEVVTADGKCFETGFGRFEGSRIANLMRSGVGPSLDGLFTQSSLGIVTAATFWLPRRPRHHASILVLTPTRSRIGELFDAIGEAARQGLLRDGAAFAMGAYKLASILLRREDFAPAGVRLGWQDLSRHSRRWANAAWLLAATVEADTKDVLYAKIRGLKAILRDSLEPGERIVVLTEWRSRLARSLVGLLPRPLAGVVRQILDVFYDRTPLLGHSIDQPLRTVYWAIPRTQPVTFTDLPADGVGLLWLSVPVPLRGSDIADVTSIIDDGLLEYGFEPSTQVTLVSERLARVITGLMYNRADAGQDRQALECQTAIYAELQRRGYYTYRLQPHLMTQYAAHGPEHQFVVGRIKAALDPLSVLDSSRYPGLPLPRTVADPS